MPLQPSPDDLESVRLRTLHRYRLGAPGLEAAFDRLARFAAELLGAPVGFVSFVEDGRQIIKGQFGTLLEAAPGESFCAHAVAGREVLVVPDARDDARFRAMSCVTREGGVRFYAGAPVVVPGGHGLGAVCVVDAVPRPPLAARERDLLRGLAEIVADHLAHRRLDLVRRAALRIAATNPDAIVCSDAEGTIVFWNRAAERIFGYTRGEILGQPLRRLLPPNMRARVETHMARLLAAGAGAAADDRRLEARGLRRDGSEVPVEISVTTWRDGPHVQVGTLVRDLSERERVRRLAQIDGLTGLPNRASFLERVDGALAGADAFAVLKIGLDRFKAVNGAMGMAAGDRLLAIAGARVRDEAGAGAAVARLGADEFGVLIEGCDSPVAGRALAGRLVARIGEPYDLGASSCHVGASVGVAICRGLTGDDTADGVLRRALLALQSAKAAGGRRFALFRPQLGQDAEERRCVEDALRGALARGEFELHVQPQVALPGGELLGAEALLRWRHPERGLLAPAAFLSTLEGSEAAVAVGRWILREVCAFAAGMAARGIPIQVGVNLFAAQLRDPGLAADVADALAAAGLPGRYLEVEITETTVLGLDEAAVAPLLRLRELGVGVAFDDYGTGYASLSLLKRYPLTRLKIDREFVRDLQVDPDDAAIVKAVIALGASFGLSVIAEGIETPEQAEALAGFGCRQAQGYLFGRPMPQAEFMARHASTVLPEVA